MSTTSPHSWKWILTAILLAGGGLRFFGLGWGTDVETGFLHPFHTDESTVIDGSKWVGVDLRQIKASYGKAPAYLLRGLAFVVEKTTGLDLRNPKDNASQRTLYLLGRSISAALGTLTILAVFYIGLSLDSPWTGLLSAFFLAFSPGHVQQSHYYTVDVSFTFWVTSALFLMLRMPSNRTWEYILCGALCGLATGTRLAGIWLGIPFLIANLWDRRQRRILLPLASYLGTAALVTCICEPFLLLDPDHFFSTQDVRQLMLSVQVARGDLIEIWSLYDFSTTPYLFYITHLFRYALGSPLEILGIGGVLAISWRRTRSGWVLLGWLIPYFIVVGGLHTKPIRYTTPMLPILVVLGAWASLQLGHWFHSKTQQVWTIPLPAILVGLPTFLYGLAFMTIYTSEDSRISAARWVQQSIPHGETVLAERGGFQTLWMVPEAQYRRKVDDAAFFVNSEGCYPYWKYVDELKEKLTGVNWILIIEENRMRQYLEVPNRYPIGYAFYHGLASGELGFKHIRSFKISPAIPGWEFSEKDAEPSITAFDHPRVSVYSRTQHTDRLFALWEKKARSNPILPDRHIRAGAEAYKQKNWKSATAQFQNAVQIRPTFLLGHLLLREAYLKQGRVSEAKQALTQALKVHSYIPIAAVEGMLEVGLLSEGAQFLDKFLVSYSESPEIRTLAAHTWSAISKAQLAASQLEEAHQAIDKAISLAPSQPNNHWNDYFNLGYHYHKRGQIEKAIEIYENVLKAKPGFVDGHINLGIMFYSTTQFQKALQTFQLAAQLAPDQPEVLLGLAQSHEQLGHRQKAIQSYQKVLQIEPHNTAAIENLSRLNNLK